MHLSPPVKRLVAAVHLSPPAKGLVVAVDAGWEAERLRLVVFSSVDPSALARVDHARLC